MTLESRRKMNRTTIGAVNVPITIENIQLGPKGAVSTPIKLITREKTAKPAQRDGFNAVFTSLFVSVPIRVH